MADVAQLVEHRIVVPAVAGSIPVVRPSLLLPTLLMTNAEALILGVVQGLTEFLPVSSSGHLIIFQSLFGIQDLENLLVFDLVCHLGTLASIFFFFSKRIALLFGHDLRTLIRLAIGTLPLVSIVFVLPYVEKLFNSPYWLWAPFFVTAGLLYAAQRWGHEKNEALLYKHSWRDAFIVGWVQCIAVIPGISRSGSTIAAARLLGFSKQDAVVFSFLLAIPAILGGATVEILQLIFKPEKAQLVDISLLEYAVGFFASFLTGLAALALLVRVILLDALNYFACYCLAIGLFCLLYFVIL